MQGIDLGDRLERNLHLTSARMKLTAGNMANIDTLGYKTQGFDFSQEFFRTIRSETSATGQVHGTDVDGFVSRPDGNNVSINREAILLAKKKLHFRTLVALLKGENDRMTKAIFLDVR